MRIQALLAALVLACATPGTGHAGPIPTFKPEPIPGAGDWMLLRPSDPHMGCSARVQGAEVDTLLMRNTVGALVLMAGRPEWDSWPTEGFGVTLSVDGAEPVGLKAVQAGSIVMMKIDDPGLAARIQAAKTLDWVLPSGRYHAEVEGLGMAYKAMQAC